MLESRSSSLSGMSFTSLGAYLVRTFSKCVFNCFVCFSTLVVTTPPPFLSRPLYHLSSIALLAGVPLLRVIWCRGNYTKQCRTLFVVMVTIYHPAVCVSTHTSLT